MIADIDKDVLTQTKCLILSVNEPSLMSDVIDAASDIQVRKPVGVLVEEQNLEKASKQINATVPFPLILKDRGKSMKSNS